MDLSEIQSTIPIFMPQSLQISLKFYIASAYECVCMCACALVCVRACVCVCVCVCVCLCTTLITLVKLSSSTSMYTIHDYIQVI